MEARRLDGRISSGLDSSTYQLDHKLRDIQRSRTNLFYRLSYKPRNNPIGHPLLLSKCSQILVILETSNASRILTGTGGP